MPWRLLYSCIALIKTWLKPLGPASRFAICLNCSRIGTSSGPTEKLVMIVDLFNNLFNNSSLSIILSFLLLLSPTIINSHVSKTLRQPPFPSVQTVFAMRTLHGLLNPGHPDITTERTFHRNFPCQKITLQPLLASLYYEHLMIS